MMPSPALLSLVLSTSAATPAERQTTSVPIAAKQSAPTPVAPPIERRAPPSPGRVAGGAVLFGVVGIVGSLGGAFASLVIASFSRDTGYLIGVTVVTQTGSLAAIIGGIALMTAPGAPIRPGVSLAPMVVPVGNDGAVVGIQGSF